MNARSLLFVLLAAMAGLGLYAVMREAAAPDGAAVDQADEVALLPGAVSDATPDRDPGRQAEPAEVMPAASDPVARGEEIFTQSGCAGCHGPVGLPLYNVPIYTDEDIASILAAPPAGMPTFSFPDDDMAALIAYLRATNG